MAAEDDALIQARGLVKRFGGFNAVDRIDFSVAQGEVFVGQADFYRTRLRRIAGDTVRVGAALDGDYILDAGMTSPIDNMEGLAVSLDSAGRTILTLVSDDNFSLFQRTLILQFALAED